MPLGKRPVYFDAALPTYITGIDSSADIISSLNTKDTWRISTVGDTNPLIVPAGYEYNLISIWVEVVTTATVGDRQLVIQIEDFDGAASPVLLEPARTGTVQPESTTRYYLFATGAVDLTAFRDTDYLTTPIPPLYLRPFNVVTVYDNNSIDPLDEITVTFKIASRNIEYSPPLPTIWFDLEESVGNNRIDCMQGYSAAELLNPIERNAGIQGNAAEFDSTGYLRMPTNSDIQGWNSNTVSYGITCWANIFSPNPLTTASGVLGFYSGAAGNRTLAIYYYDEQFYFNSYYPIAPFAHVAIAPKIISLNTWYMITVSYNHNTRLVDFYVNNKKEITVEIINNMSLGNYPLIMGSYAETPFAYMTGRVDSVGLWKGYAPTEEDVNWLWNFGNGRSCGDFVRSKSLTPKHVPIGLLLSLTYS